MNALIIDTMRTGYGVDQCGRTMTVAELMAFLDEFDEDLPVYLGFDNRYTYGAIREEYFSEVSPEDE